MAHTVPARLTGRYTSAAGRRFGFTTGAALLLLAGLAAWRGHPRASVLVAGIGALLGAAALVAPSRLGPVERAWMALALAMSKVTTPLFMGFLYFLVLTPVGVLRRTFGANPLVHQPAIGLGVWAERTSSPRGALDRLF